MSNILISGVDLQLCFGAMFVLDFVPAFATVSGMSFGTFFWNRLNCCFSGLGDLLGRFVSFLSFRLYRTLIVSSRFPSFLSCVVLRLPARPTTSNPLMHPTATHPPINIPPTLHATMTINATYARTTRMHMQACEHIKPPRPTNKSVVVIAKYSCIKRDPASISSNVIQ